MIVPSTKFVNFSVKLIKAAGEKRLRYKGLAYLKETGNCYASDGCCVISAKPAVFGVKEPEESGVYAYGKFNNDWTIRYYGKREPVILQSETGGEFQRRAAFLGKNASKKALLEILNK